MINISIGADGTININQESKEERMEIQAASYARQKEIQADMDRQINGGDPAELFQNGYGAGLGMIDVALQTGGIEDVYAVLAANIDGWTPPEGVHIDAPAATQIVSDEDQANGYSFEDRHGDADGPNYEADSPLDYDMETEALAAVAQTEAWSELREAFGAETDDDMRKVLGELQKDADRESELDDWANAPAVVTIDPLINAVADSGEPELEQSDAPVASEGQWTLSAEEMASREQAAFVRGQENATEAIERFGLRNPERKFQNVTTRRTLQRIVDEINADTNKGDDPMDAVVALAKRLGYEIL